MQGQFRTGWRQVFACATLMATAGIVASAYSVIAVPLAREFQVNRMTLMLAMTVMSGASALMTPFMGNLMDRWSLRATMMTGALMLASGFAALSFATSFNQVLVIYAVLMSPINVLIGPMAATVLLSRWFVARRGAAIGMAVAGVGIGGLLLPPLAQLLLDHFYWRDALRIFAFILLLIAVPAAAMIINWPRDRGMHADGADAEPVQNRVMAAAPGASVRDILTDPSFWLLSILMMIIVSGLKGMITNLVPLALDAGIKAGVAALLISIFSASSIASKFVFAAIADRLSSRILMAIALAGFGVGNLCLTQAQAGYGMIALGVGFLGFFGGFAVPLQSFLVPRIFGETVVGRATGLVAFATFFGLLATPPLFGWIFDTTGTYGPAFAAFAVLSMIGILAVPMLRLNTQAEAADARTDVAAADSSI